MEYLAARAHVHGQRISLYSAYAEISSRQARPALPSRTGKRARLFRGDRPNLRNRNGAAAADKFDRTLGTRVAGRVTGENDVCSTGRGGVSTYRGRRGPRNDSVSSKPRDIPTHLIAFHRQSLFDSHLAYVTVFPPPSCATRLLLHFSCSKKAERHGAERRLDNSTPWNHGELRGEVEEHRYHVQDQPHPTGRQGEAEDALAEQLDTRRCHWLGDPDDRPGRGDRHRHFGVHRLRRLHRQHGLGPLESPDLPNLWLRRHDRHTMRRSHQWGPREPRHNSGGGDPGEEVPTNGSVLHLCPMCGQLAGLRAAEADNTVESAVLHFPSQSQLLLHDRRLHRPERQPGLPGGDHSHCGVGAVRLWPLGLQEREEHGLGVHQIRPVHRCAVHGVHPLHRQQHEPCQEPGPRHLERLLGQPLDILGGPYLRSHRGGPSVPLPLPLQEDPGAPEQREPQGCGDVDWG